MKEILTYRPLPVKLPFKQGWLAGSTLHDWRYPPEPETVAFFEKHLTKDDIVADIGANIGYYTVLFSKLAKHVVALEPSPSVFKTLQSNATLPNVTLINKGAYSYRTNLSLWGGDKSGHASLIHQNGNATLVPLIPLVSLHHHFTWAKIDVEGAEMEVLRGMEPCNVVCEEAGIKNHMDEVLKTYEIFPIGTENVYLKPRS